MNSKIKQILKDCLHCNPEVLNPLKGNLIPERFRSVLRSRSQRSALMKENVLKVQSSIYMLDHQSNSCWNFAFAHLDNGFMFNGNH